MKISAQAKEEIATPPSKGCCRRARFAGILRTAGSIVIDSDGMRVKLSTDNPHVSEYAAAYVFEKYGGDTSIKRGKHITVTFSGDYVTRLLTENGVLSGEAGGYSRVSGIAPYLTKGACCIGEYIRGAFLGCGFLSSDLHHIEFAFATEDVADDFAKLLDITVGRPGQVVRGDKYVVYYSGKSRVCDALTYLGATKAALAAVDSIVRSDVKRKSMARRNCDLANIDRALKASSEQAAAIEFIDRNYGLDNLDDKLEMIAHVRQGYPDASLTELAELTGLTKSGVKHRMDKLMEFAEKLRNGKDK